VTLLGWGLDDLMGYFSLSPRLWYAAVVGLFSLAVGIQAYGSVEGIRGGGGVGFISGHILRIPFLDWLGSQCCLPGSHPVSHPG
jgi:hypothetical protein